MTKCLLACGFTKTKADWRPMAADYRRIFSGHAVFGRAARAPSCGRVREGARGQSARATKQEAREGLSARSIPTKPRAYHDAGEPRSLPRRVTRGVVHQPHVATSYSRALRQTACAAAPPRAPVAPHPRLVEDGRASGLWPHDMAAAGTRKPGAEDAARDALQLRAAACRHSRPRKRLLLCRHCNRRHPPRPPAQGTASVGGAPRTGR